MALLNSFDSKQLRIVLGTFTTGVTIVTTHGTDGGDYGVTANSFSSVSLDPPLVLWSQALTSGSFPAFLNSDRFAVNILADDQIEIANHFARSKTDKFAQRTFTRGLGNVPVLPGTVAHFECLKVAAYPAGDHMIFVGKVECVSHSGRRPLAFAHGRYMVPYAHELGPVSLLEAKGTAPTCDAVTYAMDALSSVSKRLEDSTVGLAVWGNHGPTLVRWHTSAHATEQGLRVGQVLSPTRSATGLAFAAFMSPDITDPFLKEDLRLFRVADEDEQAQRARLEKQIASAKAHGVAAAFDIRSSALMNVSANVFSAPIYDAEGCMVFALSVAAPATLLPSDPGGPIPQALRGAADELTQSIRKN